jgi:hypothetical protein
LSAPDPNPNRDLKLIDGALAKGRATASEPRERQLEELALALRDEAPTPDPAFARALDKRVDEGFKRPRRFKLPLPGLARTRMLALAGAAAVLVAVVAAIGVVSGGSDDQQSVASRTSSDAGPALAQATDPGGTAPAPGGAVAGSPTRHVERSAQMTLGAAADELQKVADSIGNVTEAHGGYVVSSNFSTGAESTRGGSFVLRVPTAQLETTLGELGQLGTVRARSESSQDMTAPYRHTQNRLGDLLLERRATIDRLHTATGDEALKMRGLLRQINAEIKDLSSRMRGLKQRTVFSTVTVTLEQQPGTGAGAGSRNGPSGALHDAVGTLAGALELTIRALGVVVPLGLIGLLAWLAATAVRRRRREAALF